MASMNASPLCCNPSFNEQLKMEKLPLTNEAPSPIAMPTVQTFRRSRPRRCVNEPRGKIDSLMRGHVSESRSLRAADRPGPAYTAHPGDPSPSRNGRDDGWPPANRGGARDPTD